VALAEGGLRGAVRDYGRIANTPAGDCVYFSAVFDAHNGIKCIL
jgi:hypothetical protein